MFVILGCDMVAVRWWYHELWRSYQQWGSQVFFIISNSQEDVTPFLVLLFDFRIDFFNGLFLVELSVPNCGIECDFH